jgi:hypothetical protein
MTDLPKEGAEQKETRIRRGRVESVDLYEIKDGELDILEKGSPADTQLNFGLALLAMAFTALCSLLTATFENKTAVTVFIVATIVGFVIGLYFLVSWWKNRTSLKEICRKIRERIPPESTILLPTDIKSNSHPR